AERRRLAGLLQEQILEQLNLLLAQAGAYGQTLGTNPAAGMALSVITTLARQIRQQVKDLEANLRPTVLETLGLEPALEALANQTMRAHGLQITLSLQRMAHRPPPQVELALFRAAQDALERAVRHAHASQVTVQLQPQDEQLIFSLTDNSTAPAGRASGLLRPARQRIEQLGGTFQTAPAAPSGFRVTVRFPIEPPVELTPREMDVIQLLVEGLSNKEIARSLSISPRTVNFHLDNIYSKLNLNSRTEAAVYALRHGWLRRPV
ncbi:MAG: hybrid sensor histidine kinase/response regulator transcription factor, partial [Anaerolineae bacterium]